MAADGDITLEVENGIALITLDRPESGNTLSQAMLSALGSAYRDCDQDDAVKVVVVTGSGEAFCAGADMSGGDATFDGDSVGNEFSSCPLTFNAWDVRKPVIAACNGHAVGVGFSIALQADLRILAEEGKYGLLQNRRGVVADFAMEYVLPRLVGVEKAFELLVRAPKLSGQEACDWGLASRCRPAAEVLPTAMGIAEDMAQHCAPLVMGLHKRLLWRGLDASREALVAMETRALHHSMAQPDAIEGVSAWLERRTPQWTASLNQNWPEDFE